MWHMRCGEVPRIAKLHIVEDYLYTTVNSDTMIVIQSLTDMDL